jgi:DMSO/TMAO reductase YedYZ heme-binding membrane subunit
MLWLRLIFAAPLFYWIWGIVSQSLGAEPIVKLNIQTGYTGLSFLLFNLLLGWMIWLKNKTLLNAMRPLVRERRWLGIFSGIYLTLHFATYFAKEAFEANALTQIFTKTYLIFAFSAYCLIFVLTLTSNDLSVRLLKHKNWKKLHKLVHLAFLILMGHLFLIEKGNLLLLAGMVFPVLILQIWRFGFYLQQRLRN